MPVDSVVAARQLLSAFETSFSDRLLPEVFRGLRFEFQTQTIQVLYDRSVDDATALDALSLPARVDFSVSNQQMEFDVAIIRETIFNALAAFQESLSPHSILPVQGGIAVRGRGVPGFGTLGWVVILDGRLVGVSSWHVLCPAETTPLGHPVDAFGRQIGVLSEREIGGLWDLALVALTDANINATAMRACDDGIEKPAPRNLGTASDLTPAATFAKVGARPPHCRTGQLIAYGTARVRYNDGLIRQFIEQLFFTDMTGPGDSGAVICAEQNRNVLGLAFASDNSWSVANPIYRKGWRYNGTKTIANMEVPDFTSEILLYSADQQHEAPKSSRDASFSLPRLLRRVLRILGPKK